MYTKCQFLVQLWPQCTPRRWLKWIQIIENRSPISFQLSMKTIITFCSIWTFFGYDWVIGLGSKTKGSQLRLAPLFQKPLTIVSDRFLTLDLFLSATHKGWKESIGFPDTELYAKFFEKNSWKESNILEARLAVTGEFVLLLVLIDSKGKIFKADRKKSLYRVSNYSTVLVISKIYIFLPLYFTLVLLLIMQSQPTSTAWTVTSTVEFYHHCWSYTEYSYLLWTRCDIFYINMVCNNTYTWKTPSDEWYF